MKSCFKDSSVTFTNVVAIAAMPSLLCSPVGNSGTAERNYERGDRDKNSAFCMVTWGTSQQVDK